MTKTKETLQMRRSLAELNLMDDFLFQEVISRGKKGEEVCRILLSTILNRPIGQVKVTAQKIILGTDTNLHGIRMDAYIESEETADMDVELEPAIYDMEPNNTYEKDKLPWRTRYYQALIDAKQLESGWDYQKLKNVYIIMILPYDPFDRNRMVYTVKNQCVEAPDIPYEDGAKKIYLNTKGTEGTPSQALKNMLKYIENSIAENVTDTNIQAIHNYVSEVKQDKEVGVQYMKSWEREALIREEGKEEGRQAGLEEGRKTGIEEGRKSGIEEGEQRINQLILKLKEAGRIEDIIKAASDAEYQQLLLKEYGLLDV